jgi:hypothetical protein
VRSSKTLGIDWDREWESPVAVEKLTHHKMTKKLCTGKPLQTTFSVWVEHFLSPKFRLFLENWSFSTAKPATGVSRREINDVIRFGRPESRVRKSQQMECWSGHRLLLILASIGAET